MYAIMSIRNSKAILITGIKLYFSENKANKSV